MNCSTPGLPVHHQLPESTQTHVHWVSDAIQHHLIIISSSVVPFSCPQSLPSSGSFPMSQLFASHGQSIGVSASASVLPMNTQDWSPLGWTGWISLQFKGLSRVFSNTTAQKHQFFGAQLSSQPNSHIHHDLWTSHSLDKSLLSVSSPQAVSPVCAQKVFAALVMNRLYFFYFWTFDNSQSKPLFLVNRVFKIHLSLHFNSLPLPSPLASHTFCSLFPFLVFFP